jgi:hypothetical protein
MAMYIYVYMLWAKEWHISKLCAQLQDTVHTHKKGREKDCPQKIIYIKLYGRKGKTWVQTNDMI